MLHRVGLAAAMLLAGCGHDHFEETAPGLADVIYEGGANDEALEALLAATPIADSESAASLVSPEEGASVPRAEPVELRWELGAEARGVEMPVHRLGRTLGVNALFGHGTPVNGRAYYVVLSTPEDDQLVRVFTGLTAYTPSDAVWAAITSAGAPISVVITAGTYDNNLLAADGGPFVGERVTFSIAP